MAGATPTNVYDFYNQAMANQTQPNYTSSVLTVPAREWNTTRLLDAGVMPGFGVPLSSTAPANAQDVAAMYNQAMQAGASGSMFAPTPPEWMSAEEYYQFLDMMQGAQQSTAQENRAQGGLQSAASVYQQMMTNPSLTQAQNIAGQTGMGNDIYAAMRSSYDNQFMPQATSQAYDTAASGMQGGSTGQLASLGLMAQRAGDVAGMYPQALQTAEQLRSSQVNTALQPAALQQQAGSDYLRTIAQMLGTLFGSGASNYSY